MIETTYQKSTVNGNTAGLLLIEDSIALARVYQEYLGELGLEVRHVTEGRAGLRQIDADMPGIVLLDLNLPDINGLEVLESLNTSERRPIVIVITAHGSVDMAVEAMRLGAFDFLQKPFDAERLRVTVRNALEKHNLASIVETYRQNFSRDTFHSFLGSSMPMQAVYRIIESAASSRATVFITGQSGTGKEVCAEAIHQEGDRSNAPFIPLNCAAIPRDLMESEIFGHVKGAFTGADKERNGAASLADGGTLFLDEIGEMDIDLQSKLLRFIQTGSFQKVGSSKTETVDVRFVCATNRDPLEMVREGRFREDLYYRLHVIPIHLPSLHERDEDVLQIAEHFLHEYSDEENKNFSGFDDYVRNLFLQYLWPGNVRELQNVIRNTVVLNNGDQVTKDMLPLTLGQQVTESTPPETPVPAVYTETLISQSTESIRPLWIIEKETIEKAIDKCGGNVPRAAAMLEISPSTIYRKRQTWENISS